MVLGVKKICAALVVPLVFGFLVAAQAEDVADAFEMASMALQTPAQQGVSTSSYELHPGESAYFPPIAPEITPFDEQTQTIDAPVNGHFESSNESVVTVDVHGIMTAHVEGEAVVIYHSAEGILSFSITVRQDVPTEIAKNMAYIAQREFYTTKRARLPKYNKYAKWYYGKKKEVGWCSVFGIWCANAAGSNPLKKSEAENVPASATLYLREGQVGNQFDGFMKLDRFGGVPRVGYMVIYADMSNAYRTTHIGIVVDVKSQGNEVYQVTTVEGNMSNSVKSYCYLYDAKLDNHLVGTEKGKKLQWNMSEVSKENQTDPLAQYSLHTDHWAVFGFCESWK